jgi:hypothetical protein
MVSRLRFDADGRLGRIPVFEESQMSPRWSHLLALVAVVGSAGRSAAGHFSSPPQVQLDITVLAVSDAAFRDEAAIAGTESGHSTLMPDAQALALVRRIREGGKAAVLAEPKIVALSGRPATFESGSGVGVTVLSIVMPDRRIYLESSVAYTECRTQTVTAVSKDESPDPGPASRSTAVMIPADRTLLLYGGSFERPTADLHMFSGKKPYVKKLFQSETAHVLFLVTPHVVTPVESGAAEEQEAPPVRPERGVEEQAEAELAKLLERYHRACAEGRVAAARKLAEQCLNLDPTCFSRK